MAPKVPVTGKFRDLGHLARSGARGRALRSLPGVNVRGRGRVPGRGRPARSYSRAPGPPAPRPTRPGASSRSNHAACGRGGAIRWSEFAGPRPRIADPRAEVPLGDHAMMRRAEEDEIPGGRLSPAREGAHVVVLEATPFLAATAVHADERATLAVAPGHLPPHRRRNDARRTIGGAARARAGIDPCRTRSLRAHRSPHAHRSLRAHRGPHAHRGLRAHRGLHARPRPRPHPRAAAAASTATTEAAGFELLHVQGERAVEDLGDIAAGNLMTTQFAGPVELRARRGRDRDPQVEVEDTADRGQAGGGRAGGGRAGGGRAGGGRAGGGRAGGGRVGRAGVGNAQIGRREEADHRGGRPADRAASRASAAARRADEVARCADVVAGAPGVVV
jgi:uncharacterized membrane protein YgcG